MPVTVTRVAAIHGFPAAEADLPMGAVGPRSMHARADAEHLQSYGDAQLALRVQRGEAAAFDVLVCRHMQRAFRVAYRLLGQREDAEDLVQEAFLTALQKIDTFDAEREFSPWFYRILINRCLNARKARARRVTSELPAEAASSTASPLIDAERSQLRDHLDRALHELPERQRTIVMLFDLEGFSSPEIAAALGISDGTVRWHLHQARRALRQALEPYARRQA